MQYTGFLEVPNNESASLLAVDIKTGKRVLHKNVKFLLDVSPVNNNNFLMAGEEVYFAQIEPWEVNEILGSDKLSSTVLNVHVSKNRKYGLALDFGIKNSFVLNLAKKTISH